MCSWRAVLKQYYEMRHFLGFKFRVILNLYWIPFDAVVVFRPEHDFLFKSAIDAKRGQLLMFSHFLVPTYLSVDFLGSNQTIIPRHI